MYYKVYKEIRYIAGWEVVRTDVLTTEDARDAFLAFDKELDNMFRQARLGGHFRLDGSIPILVQGGIVTTLHLRKEGA